MGYSTTTIETKGQQQMVGGTFVSVGDETIDIQDITVAGGVVDEGAWIKWWDPVAKKYSDYVKYVSELCDADGNPLVPTRAGWGDGDWIPVEKSFAPGEGFWWGADQNGLGLTLSGEVIQPAAEYVGRTITTKGQQQMIINAFPTALDIQGITVDGGVVDEGAWIKWWDPVAKKYSDYVKYVSELCDADGNPLVPTRAGWGDGDWVPVEKSFATGEGFWWGADQNNLTICIPNPFFKGDK